MCCITYKIQLEFAYRFTEVTLAQAGMVGMYSWREWTGEASRSCYEGAPEWVERRIKNVKSALETTVTSQLALSLSLLVPFLSLLSGFKWGSSLSQRI